MGLSKKELKSLIAQSESIQGTVLASKLLDLLRENKLYATLFAIGGLHLLRYLAKGRCQQGLITFLQALSAGGYLGSELEGEAQNAVIAGCLLVGGGFAAFECLTEAGIDLTQIPLADLPLVDAIPGKVYIPKWGVGTTEPVSLEEFRRKRRTFIEETFAKTQG